MSFLSLFWALDSAIAGNVNVFLWLGFILYAGFFVAFLYLDFRLRRHLGKADERLLLATYVLFFLNFPPLVYLYTGVHLLILLAACSQRGMKASPGLLWRFGLLTGLALAPARGIALTTSGTFSMFADVVPPMADLGLFAVALALRISLLRAAPPQYGCPAEFGALPAPQTFESVADGSPRRSKKSVGQNGFTGQRRG